MVLYLWNCSPNKGRHSHHLPVRPAHQRQTGAHEAVTFAGCSAGAHPTSCWVPEPLPGGGAPPGSITDSDTRPGRQVTSAQPQPAMPRAQGPALGYCRGQAAVQSSWGRACAHVCACGPGEGPVTVLTWGPTARRGHLLRPGGAGTSRTQHLPGTCSLLARRPRSPSGTIPLPPGPGGSASPSCPGTGAGKCLISLILSGGLSPPPAARTAPPPPPPPPRQNHMQGAGSTMAWCALSGWADSRVPRAGAKQDNPGWWMEQLQCHPWTFAYITPPAQHIPFPALWFTLFTSSRKASLWVRSPPCYPCLTFTMQRGPL